MGHFDEYINSEDLDKREKARNWSIAIGLQAVDGLKVSNYLLEIAKLNIEGLIDFDEVDRRIAEYHKSKKRASDTVLELIKPIRTSRHKR